VSRPVHLGGLGFTYKWNMGWMHDILEYAQRDPVHRRWAHTLVTFSGLYMFTENFVLPFSHDEVVHGKGSMLDKIPGDVWQKHATLRTIYGFMFGHPGKKLLFMGSEFGQWREWSHDRSLDWHLLDDPRHEGLQWLVGHLNRLHRGEPALHELDHDPAGFEWIDANDSEHSVISLLRLGREGKERVLAVFNFTPVVRQNYRLGVPGGGLWREILNSDAKEYGGSGQGNLGGVEAVPVPLHGRSHSLTVTLPPLGAVFLKSGR
jgi:1,4-alpha-glucan branching enzyme